MDGKNKFKPIERKKEKPRYKWVIGVVLVFALAVVIWQFVKYRIVNNGLSKTVAEKTHGLYSIQYESILLDEVGGALHIKNIIIAPDTAVYNRMAAEKKAPPMLLRLTIPSLDITGVKTPKALLNKEIEGEKIEIRKPVIEVDIHNFSRDSTLYNPGNDLYTQLIGKLLKIGINSVQVVEAKVTVRNGKANSIAFSGENVSFVFSDLLIDSNTRYDSSRILFSKELDMTCDKLLLPEKSKKYRLDIEKLHFKSRNNSLFLGRLSFVPQLSEAEFARSSPTQKDRYSISLENVGLINIDRARLWRKGIGADSLVIGQGSFKIFRDLSYPRDTLSRVGKYPQQMLMRLKTPINIRQLFCDHCFIEYKEKNAKSDSAGKVQFYDVRATVSNITNEKAAIARDDKCIILFHARFLNKTPVAATVVWVLKDPRGRFSIGGDIGPIQVASLNPLTEPMGLARMEKGKIHRLHFYFTGTDSSSSGRLTMLYDDLKVSLLKKNNQRNEYDKKGLASLVAGILIKKSNPAADGKTRTVDVKYKRDLNKSFFNLVWKSLFTGIKESVGMKL